MKRFRFELEALLKLKDRAVESVKEELAHKNREILHAQEQFESIQKELKNFQAEQKEHRMAGSSVLEMRFSVNYRNKLKMDLLAGGKRVQNLQADAYIITQRLVKANQEKKSIDILREKRYLEWKKGLNAEEQRFTDDVSGQMYIRKQRSVPDETV